MHRFFVDSVNGDTALLSKDDSRHAIKVLRLQVGDSVAICDCAGFDYEGEITWADNNAVGVKLSNKRPSETESKLKISLIQCLPKTGKMEVIIQKCTELGVCDFYPVESKRCVVRVDEKSAKSKVERYNKVAYEAAKQSCRGIIPRVHDFGTLKGFDFSSFDFVIIPYEEDNTTTVKALVNSFGLLSADNTRVAIIIGPEGGFEESEVLDIVEQGGHSVTLGRRILRTETAGMATVAMLMGLVEG